MRPPAAHSCNSKPFVFCPSVGLISRGLVKKVDNLSDFTSFQNTREGLMPPTRPRYIGVEDAVISPMK
jgi:hypothetical protein